MKKIIVISFLFVSSFLSAQVVTSVLEKNTLIQLNTATTKIEVLKTNIKLYKAGNVVYVYDNSRSNHQILYKQATVYALDFNSISNPSCPTADSLYSFIVLNYLDQ